MLFQHICISNAEETCQKSYRNFLWSLLADQALWEGGHCPSAPAAAQKCRTRKVEGAQINLKKKKKAANQTFQTPETLPQKNGFVRQARAEPGSQSYLHLLLCSKVWAKPCQQSPDVGLGLCSNSEKTPANLRDCVCVCASEKN